jgi:hypothetical protein
MAAYKSTPLFGGALSSDLPNNFADVRYDSIFFQQKKKKKKRAREVMSKCTGSQADREFLT